MKKIYLLSGPGMKEGYSKKIKEELKKDLKGTKKITFISSSPSNHEKNLKYIYGNNEVIGIINHLKEIHSFDEINIVDDLNTNINEIINSDVVYLLGGNPKTQLDFILEHNFDTVLNDYNGILLCTSSGAMNVAKYGYYSKDEDFDKSFFYEGINLVNITIDPHFDIKNQEQVSEALKMSKIHKIYGVPNESCIKIADNNIKLIGKIYIYENGVLKDCD